MHMGAQNPTERPTLYYACGAFIYALASHLNFFMALSFLFFLSFQESQKNTRKILKDQLRTGQFKV